MLKNHVFRDSDVLHIPESFERMDEGICLFILTLIYIFLSL